MKKVRFFNCMLFLLLINIVPSNLQAAFAELVHLSHDCGEGGSVEYELNGPEEFYTVEWEHGPTDLALENLSPGIYTLIITDFYGCIEEYQIEILEAGGCFMNTFVSYSIDPCVAYIVLTVFTNNGEIITEDALDIVWADGNTSGLIRQVTLGQNGSYEVTVSLNGEGESCCLLNEVININQSPNCIRECTTDIVVNEINRHTDGEGQYIELLVTGKCECEKRVDLRGYIIDDNNGLLIPANQSTNSFNAAQSIGVDQGYLSFSYSNAWASIPNGSLIVLYNRRGNSIPELPTDDPTDINEDCVYVLSANNPEYFYGKTGLWNDNAGQMEYVGILTEPTWQEISPDADGVQIRTPEGEFHHGISTGEIEPGQINEFPLWVGNQSSTNHNLSLTGTEFDQASSFTYLLPTSLSRTPGSPNSEENREKIRRLKECDERDGGKRGQFVKDIQLEQLTVFPNPFTTILNLNFQSSEVGFSTLNIYSSSGQLIQNKTISTNAGPNKQVLEIDKNVPTGLLLLEMTFPSGKVETVRVTHIFKD